MIGRGRNLSEKREELALRVRSAEPERLDIYLWSHLNWKSRTRLQRLIRQGRIRVNGEATKPSRRVKAGDQVTLELSAGHGYPRDYDALELDVIYEDPWLVALSKPPGLLVHPVGRHVYDTLINYLHHRYRGRTGEDGEPLLPRLCHRIDKDTTGVVVIAKDAYVHREVMSQFERRLVSKEYLALVSGDYPGEDATLSLPMGEGRCLRSCLEHEVLKESRTGVRVLARLQDAPPGDARSEEDARAGAGYTLLACIPHTGRQNQIRVHLAAAGHPIVGDERYGGGPPPPGFPARYLLHSRAIRFYHPRLKSMIELAAPPPPDFRSIIEALAPLGAAGRPS